MRAKESKTFGNRTNWYSALINNKKGLCPFLAVNDAA
jgi:hypothetical protein